MLRRAAANGGSCHALSGGGGLPIGVDAEAEYEERVIDFAAGDAMLVVSDGIVEQPAEGNVFGDRDEFGLDRTRDALCASIEAGDPVAAVFAAVARHAGTGQLADDATAVLVRW